MATRLESLFDEESFAKGFISMDLGLTSNEHNDAITYLILEYEGYFHIYLNLFDNDEPFRDILAEGIAPTLEEARDIALNNLNQLTYQGKI